MSVLSKKLWRDIRERKWQFAAIVAVVALGVALFGASYDSYQNLRNSYDQTHEVLRFADLTVSGGPYPQGIERQVVRVRGVRAAGARTVADLGVEVGDTKAVGRIVGLPAGRQPPVNKVKIIAGRFPRRDEPGSVLVEKHFAEYHRIEPGGSISVLGARGRRAFEVTGIAISPEYIWPARSRQDIIASPENFGVLFAQNQAIQALSGRNAFNEVAVLFEKDVPAGTIRARVEEALKPYGIQSSLPKKDQPSNAALSEDLQGFEELSGFFPLLFLTIASISIYVMLNRMVHAQRPQIGVLRASGYSRRAVVRHYLAFGLVSALAGAVPGILAGVLLAREVTVLYTSELSIPLVRIGFYPATLFGGIAMALAMSLLAAWAPARAAAKTRPAEAMRGETPAGGGRTSIAERLFPPLSQLSPTWKIPLRGIGRSRRRSLFTVIAIVLAMIVILASWGMLDTTNYLLDRQFNFIQQNDFRVSFPQLVPESRLDALRKVDGVTRVEPALELPIAIEHGDKRYATVLIGLERNTAMHRYFDEDGKEILLPGEGLLIGTALRSQLDVSEGDSVEISVTGMPLRFTEHIAGFVDEPLGTYAYAALEGVRRRIVSAKLPGGAAVAAPGDTSSAYVIANPAEREEAQKRLAEMPAVGAVEDQKAIYEVVQQFMVFFYVFVGVMLAFGAIMAFALIFNTMTVNVMERSRELATLRTIGFSQRRISALVTVENLLLAALGILPGLVAGYYTSKFAMAQWSSDLFSFDLYFYPTTYIWSSLAILLVALASQWPSLRAVHRLDITKIIKERTS